MPYSGISPVRKRNRKRNHHGTVDDTTPSRLGRPLHPPESRCRIGTLYGARAVTPGPSSSDPAPHDYSAHLFRRRSCVIPPRWTRTVQSSGPRRGPLMPRAGGSGVASVLSGAATSARYPVGQALAGCCELGCHRSGASPTESAEYTVTHAVRRADSSSRSAPCCDQHGGIVRWSSA